jgi:hypothetical protein
LSFTARRRFGRICGNHRCSGRTTMPDRFWSGTEEATGRWRSPVNAEAGIEISLLNVPSGSMACDEGQQEDEARRKDTASAGDTSKLRARRGSLPFRIGIKETVGPRLAFEIGARVDRERLRDCVDVPIKAEGAGATRLSVSPWPRPHRPPRPATPIHLPAARSANGKRGLGRRFHRGTTTRPDGGWPPRVPTLPKGM